MAKRVASLLEQKRLDVFWDNHIRFGDDFKKIIVDRLESAACVLVLWSKNSAISHWVNYEAQAALERKTLVEACLDSAKPPPPFGVLNSANLRSWKGNARGSEIQRLLESVSSRVSANTVERDFTLAAPLAGQQLTDSHLALIHTCWRTDYNDERFHGEETHRWDIALYGSKKALDRIEQVTYFLHPAYEIPDGDPPSHAVVTLKASNSRKHCFRLRQIANGHSLVRAHVKVRGQNEPVKLSRYINLFDSAARIDDYLM
jgi:hypothetical protein